MKKRILALLMALVLTVSCLPPTALAEGTQATEANIQSVEQTQPQLPEKAEKETAPALNAAHGAHTCEHCSDSSAEWKAWESGTDLPNTSGHYYLTQPVNLTTLPNGKETVAFLQKKEAHLADIIKPGDRVAVTICPADLDRARIRRMA